MYGSTPLNTKHIPCKRRTRCNWRFASFPRFWGNDFVVLQQIVTPYFPQSINVYTSVSHERSRGKGSLYLRADFADHHGLQINRLNEKKEGRKHTV